MKYLNDINYRDCVGKILKSKNFGDFKVLKYNDTANVEIQFLNTGYETSARLGDIKNGDVKDPYLQSVYGVGVLGTKYQLGLMALLQKGICYGRGCQKEHLGSFNTEIEAFNAYKTAKEAFIKEQANKWKGKIDERAYNALMNCQVEITD